MQLLIEAKGLTKKFKDREVVKGIDLEVQKGEVLALIGTNGAGKSTTLSMLLGILKPDGGLVSRWKENFKAFTGVQLQSTPFFEGYTAEENLELFSALYNRKLSKAAIQNILDECGLREAKKTPAVRLSLGQQKRLAIAVTTVHNPELVILDEPTAGLDPRARHEIRNMINQLAEKGVTVVFSSHDMEEVARIADRIILMHEGRIVADGTPENLLEIHDAENLEELYLQLTESVLLEESI